MATMLASPPVPTVSSSLEAYDLEVERGVMGEMGEGEANAADEGGEGDDAATQLTTAEALLEVKLNGEPARATAVSLKSPKSLKSLNAPEASDSVAGLWEVAQGRRFQLLCCMAFFFGAGGE